MNLSNPMGKVKEENFKYKTAIIIAIFVPALIFLVFSLTTCNVTSKVEESKHRTQKEKLYRDRFIQNYERKHQKRQLSLKDNITIKGKHLRLYLDSINDENRKEMDSLFGSWHKTIEEQHNNLIQIEATCNKNFSIWLAVIAAICTVLPVVLALHQNQTFTTSIQKIKEDIEKHSNNIDQLTARIEITSLLDTISRNCNILSDMQELENRERINLTCLEEARFYYKIICDSSHKCMTKYNEISSKFTPEDIRLIHNSCLCTLCTLREMLYRFENIFTGRNLMILQKIRCNVITDVRKAMKEDEIKKLSTKDLLGKIYAYTSLLSSLFANDK